MALVDGSGNKGASPLGFHLLLGAETKTMMTNLLENIEKGRLSVLQMVMRAEDQ